MERIHCLQEGSRSSATIISRYPIRYDSDFDVAYIDEDKNGELAIDELRTTEPTLSSDSIYSFEPADIKQLAQERNVELLTSQEIGPINLESKEREYEDGDDYQFSSLGTLQQFADSQNPNGTITSWSIDPMPQSSDEMELLIFDTGTPMNGGPEPKKASVVPAPPATPKPEVIELRPETRKRILERLGRSIGQ